MEVMPIGIGQSSAESEAQKAQIHPHDLQRLAGYSRT